MRELESAGISSREKLKSLNIERDDEAKKPDVNRRKKT
jgi:hypothetical protein